MRVVQVTERFATGQKFTLWPISDTHLGAADTDEALLRRHVAQIKDDPAARVIFLGDVGDLIDWRDARFHPGMLPQRYLDASQAEGGIPSETVAHALEIFEPIRKQIWAWFSGNHERTVRRKTDREIGSEIAAQLGAPYMGYTGFVRVRWVREGRGDHADAWTLIDCHHGYQGGRRSGAKVNEMELDLGKSDADIILRGHSHDRLAHKFNCVRAGKDQARDWTRVVGHMGTYKLGRIDSDNDSVHDTWEETRGFRRKSPDTMGPVLITMKPQRTDGKGKTSTRPSVDYRVVS
jgi:hypothetical protein